jgi:hypothetical protein
MVERRSPFHGKLRSIRSSDEDRTLLQTADMTCGMSNLASVPRASVGGDIARAG